MRSLPFLTLCIFLCMPWTTASANSQTQGAVLYAKLCAKCHGPLASTTKPNRPYGRIASAIRVVPSMYHLKGLSPDEIDALVAATEQPDRPYRGRR